MVVGILKYLLASNIDDLLELAKNRDDQNLLNLNRIAHKIKGGACIIKNQTVIESCENLERVYHGGV